MEAEEGEGGGLHQLSSKTHLIGIRRIAYMFF